MIEQKDLPLVELFLSLTEISGEDLQCFILLSKYTFSFFLQKVNNPDLFLQNVFDIKFPFRYNI